MVIYERVRGPALPRRRRPNKERDALEVDMGFLDRGDVADVSVSGIDTPIFSDGTPIGQDVD